MKNGTEKEVVFMEKVLNELNKSVTRAEGISALLSMLCELVQSGADIMDPYASTIYLIDDLATENAKKLNAIKDKLMELHESEVES